MKGQHDTPAKLVFSILAVLVLFYTLVIMAVVNGTC
jgi:hypothetical protein